MGQNALAFVDIEGSPWWPPGHPWRHHELGISGKVPRDGYVGADWDTTVVRWDMFSYAICCYWWRPGFMYFPHTTQVNPVPHWSQPMGLDGWWSVGTTSCGPVLVNLTTMDHPLPSEWDSVRVVSEMWCPEDPCPSFGAPVVDNFRVGIVGKSAASVDEEAGDDGVPQGDHLFPVSISPADGHTLVCFTLETRAHVTLSVYHLTGRVVQTLLDKYREGGQHSVSWDGKDNAGSRVSAGIYWVQMSTDSGYVSGKKMLVLR